MLTRCILAERKKLRHSLILPACILIPIIPAIMGTFNYLQNLGILKSEWYSLWTQHTLFYASFFFAPLIGLYCSYLWRLEHRNNNWNSIMTAPVPVCCIYFAKLTVILTITLLTQLWTGILYLVNDSEENARELAGRLKGLNCHVNLIPVNPVRERSFVRSTRQAVENFKINLEKCGINGTIRREMGSDIDGACGQLRKRYMEKTESEK